MTLRRISPLAILLISFLVCAARPAVTMDDPEYLNKLVQFHNAYNAFMRDLMGCPAHAVDVGECNPELGHINYAAYGKASKLAKVVFP